MLPQQDQEVKKDEKHVIYACICICGHNVCWVAVKFNEAFPVSVYLGLKFLKTNLGELIRG